MKRTAVILGGGVGGLVAAHELSKDPNTEVHLYERHSTPGGQSLSSLSEVPEWDIWKSYVYNSDGKGTDTYEPKFSNSVGTLERRPEVRDNKYSNLYHATAYARTEMNVFCMESAAEAGVKAARFITSSEPPPSRLRDGGFWDRIYEYLRSFDARKVFPYPLLPELVNVPRSNKL